MQKQPTKHTVPEYGIRFHRFFAVPITSIDVVVVERIVAKNFAKDGCNFGVFRFYRTQKSNLRKFSKVILADLVLQSTKRTYLFHTSLSLRTAASRSSTVSSSGIGYEMDLISLAPVCSFKVVSLWEVSRLQDRRGLGFDRFFSTANERTFTILNDEPGRAVKRVENY